MKLKYLIDFNFRHTDQISERTFTEILNYKIEIIRKNLSKYENVQHQHVLPQRDGGYHGHQPCPGQTCRADITTETYNVTNSLL